jgi:hypothetical protein
MFNGGADNDSAGNVPRTLDLDKLDALTGEALDALPPPELSAADQARNFASDVAMELIQGQVRGGNRSDKPDMGKARRLSTGSETDVALGADIPEVPGDEPPADLPTPEDILSLDPIDPSEFG